LRHSLEDRNPILLSVSWIPAFAGMTIRGVLQRSQLEPQFLGFSFHILYDPRSVYMKIDTSY
jgi:hypothetical protein